MGKEELRHLLKMYNLVQEYRKRLSNQLSHGPNDIIAPFFDNFESIENKIKSLITTFTDHNPLCRWATSLHRVGPITAASLYVHIDMQRCPTAGHIWSYVGYNPQMVWGKGQKRLFNDDIRRLMWNLGRGLVAPV